MSRKNTSVLYPPFKALVRLCYPKMTLCGAENLPDAPCIVVANHAQLNGPIASELYFPGKRVIWCAGQMMHLREVPSYAFTDFWSQKPRWTHGFYRLLSYLIAPLSVFIFNDAATIPVYRDSRIINTFKSSIAALQDGATLIIFPEHDVKCNNIIYDFQDKFIDLARLYYKRTSTELSFVPMYITPALKKMCLGTPVRFSAAAPIDEERARIRSAMMEEITALARALPEHTVIPYRNIPKKDYPTNRTKEVHDESTCR